MSTPRVLPAGRRANATADLPKLLMEALAGADRPLTARELGATVGVRQDAALRALRLMLRDGAVVSSCGPSQCGRRPLAFSLVPAPSPVARALRRRRAAQERPCLCCEKPFLSEGPHNRLCNACRAKSAGPFDTPAIVRYR